MKWLPIETAPKDGTYIILGGPYGAREGRWENSEDCHQWSGVKGYWLWEPFICDGEIPTHWMPFPAPPTA